MNKQDYEYLQSLREFELMLHQNIDLTIEPFISENHNLLEASFNILIEYIRKELNKLKDKYLQISYLNDCKNISYEYLKEYFIKYKFTGVYYLMFYIYSKVLNVNENNMDYDVEFMILKNKTIIIFYNTYKDIEISKDNFGDNSEEHLKMVFPNSVEINLMENYNIEDNEYYTENAIHHFIINNPVYFNPNEKKNYILIKYFSPILLFQKNFLDKEKFILKNETNLNYLDFETAKELANELELNEISIDKQAFLNFLINGDSNEVNTNLSRLAIYCLFKLLVNEKYFTEKYLKSDSNFTYIVEKTSGHYTKGERQKVNISSNLITEINKLNFHRNYKNDIEFKLVIDIFTKYFDTKPLFDLL